MVLSYHPVNKEKCLNQKKVGFATSGAGIGLYAHYEPNGPTIAEFVKPHFLL